MQKVGELEKAHKLQEQKQTRAQSKRISDELKPHKAKRVHFKMPPKYQVPQPPKRQYREYRSVILPSIAAGTWWVYRKIAEQPTNDDYEKIMGSIVVSPDLNELIQDQLTLFDESDGLGKIALTALSKVLEVSGAKLSRGEQQSASCSQPQSVAPLFVPQQPSAASDPNQAVPCDSPEEAT